MPATSAERAFPVNLPGHRPIGVAKPTSRNSTHDLSFLIRRNVRVATTRTEHPGRCGAATKASGALHCSCYRPPAVILATALSTVRRQRKMAVMRSKNY